MTTDDKIDLLIFTLVTKATRFYWIKDSSGWCTAHENGYRIQIQENLDRTLRILTEFDGEVIPDEDLNSPRTFSLRTRLMERVSVLCQDRNERIDMIIKELEKL